jgi:hypothetical protein
MVGFLFAFLVVFNATFHNISVITQRIKPDEEDIVEKSQILNI